MSHKRVRMSGMVLSTASASFSALIWIAMYVGAPGLPSLATGMPFAILSGIAVLATLHSWLAVYVMFLVRFVPVGLYLLVVPSWVALLGVVDLIYLAGGICMHIADVETNLDPTRGRR